MTERKLATIRRIADITPIAGADAIECARVDGWDVVVKRGEFQAGELVLYLEIDSWVPTELAPFLSKGKQPREFNGVKGERLRTIKLRGALSQGLILPLGPIAGNEGDDVTEAMGIQKWERPVPVHMRGQMKGNFPSFIPKTDQERVQNCFWEIPEGNYEATLKLDGSSMTVWFKDGEWGVCSRNVDLKLDQVGNVFVDTAKRVFEGKAFSGLAFQGELMGPGIQGNREGLTEHRFFVFDIFDIKRQRYMDGVQRRYACDIAGLEHVPVLGYFPRKGSVKEYIHYAEGVSSLRHPIAEGVVFKRADGGFSFKAISNKFLLGARS